MRESHRRNHTVVVKHKVTGLLDEYVQAQQAAGRAPGTIRLRMHYLTRWAATIPADQDVTAGQIRAFLAWPAWKPATRKSAAGAIRSFLRWGHRAGYTDLPASDLVDVVSVPRGMPRPADDAQILAALAAASPADALAILLAAEAGLRRAEIAAVHTRDLVAGNLIVRGKGGRERSVPVSRHLAAALGRAPARTRDGSAIDLATVGPLFPGRVAGHLSADAVGRRISRALGPGASAHNLRHRFASAAYAGELDLIAVQRLLGHTSVATTQVYTACADDALRRAVEAAELGEVPVRGVDGHPGVAGH